MFELHLSTAPYDEVEPMACQKGLNMRKTKFVLIASLTVLQMALALQFAVAAPMAHGSFNGVQGPGYALPSGKLTFIATALNDGDSTGWFRICVIHLGPNTNDYFPNPRDEVSDEVGVHCSKTVQTEPGERMTFTSDKFRMRSVPSETFWILLAVQQQSPILGGEDGTDIINLSVDDLRTEIVINLYA
jgi:hypothetical protein